MSKKSLPVLCRRIRNLTLAALILFPLPGETAPAAPSDRSMAAELAEITGRIDAQRSAWISLRAGLTLQFSKDDIPAASCTGEMLYHRLDEKIFLRCQNTNARLLFVFKTLDRRFELYLPSQRTLYRGDIFDLEDSPDIESQLQPLDFYRALKTMTVPLQSAKIEGRDKTGTAIRVVRQRAGETFVSRRLLVSNNGLVPSEIYYSRDGNPCLEIQRGDFRALPDRPETFFPRRIAFRSKRSFLTTLLTFEKISADDSAAFAPLEFKPPPDTRVIDLDENPLRTQ